MKVFSLQQLRKIVWEKKTFSSRTHVLNLNKMPDKTRKKIIAKSLSIKQICSLNSKQQSDSKTNKSSLFNNYWKIKTLNRSFARNSLTQLNFLISRTKKKIKSIPSQLTLSTKLCKEQSISSKWLDCIKILVQIHKFTVNHTLFNYFVYPSLYFLLELSFMRLYFIVESNTPIVVDMKLFSYNSWEIPIFK